MEAPEFGRHVEEGGFGVEHLLGFRTATTGRVECQEWTQGNPFIVMIYISPGNFVHNKDVLCHINPHSPLKNILDNAA